MTRTNSDTQQTLEQRRANHAWDAVQRAKDGQDPKKFGGQAKKLPMRIMAAGLGQALAFLKAKNDAPRLLEKLSDWINRCIPLKPDEPKDLLERIIKGDSDFLRRATDEVLAYLVWLNRFAEAERLTDEVEE